MVSVGAVAGFAYFLSRALLAVSTRLFDLMKHDIPVLKGLLTGNGHLDAQNVTAGDSSVTRYFDTGADRLAGW